MSTFAEASPNYRTPPSVVAAIVAISAIASLFLAWLVYYHQPVDVAGTRLSFLPALNATLNALCGVFLVIGYRHIRSMNITAHRNSMFAAFVVSSLFLVCGLCTSGCFCCRTFSARSSPCP
jgi:putative membrane protein